MKIKIRLILLFLVLFSTLLLVFAASFYLYSASSRKQEYYNHLKREAITKADMLLDAKVPPSVLQLIYKNSGNSLFEEEVAIYDTAFNLLYHDAVEIDKVKETREMIDRIVREKQITFEQGGLQVVGLLHKDHGKSYVITAGASDEFGLRRLAGLKYYLLVASMVIIGCTFFAGYFFVSRALKPVAAIVQKVEAITATNLDMRLQVKNTRDEIGELAVTFNKMLDRLEDSFESQKSFVSNISHELRTPLATLTGELQLALIKQRSNEEYREVIQYALTDAIQLARVAGGILDLAKASYEQTEISRRPVRVDEVLLEAQLAVSKTNEQWQVDIAFTDQDPDDEKSLYVYGNEYLLKVAFINLMENACKFSSPGKCQVTIQQEPALLTLAFRDAGIGIPPDDLPYIFKPFYRGSNKEYARGAGIGLSLVEKIIHLHQGSISVESGMQTGSTFRVGLPHL